MDPSRGPEAGGSGRVGMPEAEGAGEGARRVGEPVTPAGQGAKRVGEPHRRARRLAAPSLLLLAPAGVVFLIHLALYRGYLLDDAYISLRYARNLVAGHGLVWNPGERVEGYTNFLWVLLGSLFLRLRLDGMAALGLTSFVAALGTLGSTAWLRRLAGGTAIIPAAVWLLATGGFAYYATVGMETMLFACLLALGLALGLREASEGRRRGSVPVFILLTLTRPEGLLLFPLAQVALAWVEHRRRQAWGLRRRLRDLGAYTLCVGSWLCWRLAYYGDLLPNTFHAKVTWGSEQLLAGLLHLGDWALDDPLLALALLTPAALLAHRPWRAAFSPELRALWVVALAWVGYTVTIGGDSMPFHRFFLPALPLLAVLLSAQLSQLAWHLGESTRIGWYLGGRGVLLGGGVLLAVQVGAGLRSEEPVRALVAHRTTVAGLAAGDYLARTREGDDLVAVNTAGALPWASGLPALDMLGLTDPAIARREIYVTSPRWTGHRRGWGAHVLAQRPTVIVWYNAAGSREPHYLGDHQLAESPAFRFFYQLRRVELPAAGDEARVVARLRGTPFGELEDRTATLPDLGLRLEVRRRPFIHTLARGAPILFHYFERRRDLEPLWPAYQQAAGDLDRFLDAAVREWRAETRDGDPAARQEVEQLCAEALELLRAGRTDHAKELLSHAAERNGAARSPLVGQYIANLAFDEGDLLLATQAQLEALRLEPDNHLYRSNLRFLLSAPWTPPRSGPRAPAGTATAR